MEDVCMEHSAHERAIGKHDARLDSHSEAIDQLRDCVTRLTALQEQDAAWHAEAEKHIEALESAPAARWKTVETAAISTLAGGVAGAVLMAIGIQ